MPVPFHCLRLGFAAVASCQPKLMLAMAPGFASHEAATRFFPATRYGSTPRLCSTKASTRIFSIAPVNSALKHTSYFCLTIGAASHGFHVLPPSVENESFPSPANDACTFALTYAYGIGRRNIAVALPLAMSGRRWRRMLSG